jgi:hypothetical protein
MLLTVVKALDPKQSEVNKTSLFKPHTNSDKIPKSLKYMYLRLLQTVEDGSESKIFFLIAIQQSSHLLPLDDCFFPVGSADPPQAQY